MENRRRSFGNYYQNAMVKNEEEDMDDYIPFTIHFVKGGAFFCGYHFSFFAPTEHVGHAYTDVISRYREVGEGSA